MQTQQVQEAIALVFPQEYTAHTWHELLPRFIDYHIEQYHQLVEDHEQALAEWQQSDQTTPEPEYPIYPEVFAQACQERAKHEDLDHIALATGFYLIKNRLSFYKRQSQLAIQLCQDFDQASMALRDEYLTLRDSVTSGKWLN